VPIGEITCDATARWRNGSKTFARLLSIFNVFSKSDTHVICAAPKYLVYFSYVYPSTIMSADSCRQSGMIQGELNMSTLMQFVRDENAATAIEYGLIAAGIAVAIIAVVQSVGTKLTATFQSVSDNLK
jgi:pilus assembly protein Flp/PilA